MTNKEHFTHWAETHQLSTISFWWKNGNASGECRLHDSTFTEASKIAKESGYVEPRWYKPRTWNNGVVTVG